MAGVQFIGRSALIKGLGDRIEVWGLFQGKQFLVAGSGPDELDEFLEKLEPGGTGATYILKFYPGLKDDAEIDEKTPSQGAVNFKLTVAGADGSISDRLARIEGMLSGTDDDDEDEDDDPPGRSLAGVIMSYLEDPQKIATIIGAINDLKRGGVPQLSPGAVGGLYNQPATGAPTESDESKTHRLALVLDRLERADDKILVHLEKLADLAERKPDLFKLLLMQLDNGL